MNRNQFEQDIEAIFGNFPSDDLKFPRRNFTVPAIQAGGIRKSMDREEVSLVFSSDLILLARKSLFPFTPKKNDICIFQSVTYKLAGITETPSLYRFELEKANSMQ